MPRWTSGLRHGAMAAVVASALAAAPAEASRPRITKGPVITGTAEVGALLRAEGAEWRGDPEPEAEWRWLRCTSPGLDANRCQSIPGAVQPEYTATEADLDKRLRVFLTVSNKDGSAWHVSASTAPIAARPAPPPQPPSPSAEPEPGPAPFPTLQPVAPAPVAPLRVAAPRPAVPPRLMRPVPVVRIRGFATARGARITLLSVSAPRDARIAVRCRGRGCPGRRAAQAAALTRLRRFERFLPAGVRLRIAVTKPGRIGKVTTFRIRHGAPPVRTDRCLSPGRRKAVACPGA
jgi:hypothetical protein